MSASDVTAAVSLEVRIEDGRALIHCGRCGIEQILWTRVDLAVDGLAALFTEEHLQCHPVHH